MPPELWGRSGCLHPNRRRRIHRVPLNNSEIFETPSTMQTSRTSSPNRNQRIIYLSTKYNYILLYFNISFIYNSAGKRLKVRGYNWQGSQTTETMFLEYWSCANYTSCDLLYEFNKNPKPNPDTNPKWWEFDNIVFVGLIETGMFQYVSWDYPRLINFCKINLVRSIW